jgi:GT2 family glycosyltransferase/glycosyltransferase involved in cell wall biosynthesis
VNLKRIVARLRQIYLQLPLGALTRQRLNRRILGILPWLYSGYERKAKASLGHLADSADLRPTEIDFGSQKKKGAPLVSIVIPTFGKSDYTLKCLLSILDNRPEFEFEIIVVDDGSTDGTQEVLASVGGIRVVRNERNVGFVDSCNTAASIAKGDYLHFLNNDVIVTANWLVALIQTFHDFPTSGLVGSKLLYPDGTLQEAGGLVRDDGSAGNIGRFEDANHPDFNFARNVDYVSGASLLIKRDLFNRLGGFDPLYSPGYYEDTDLAQKVLNLGLSVIVQTESVVYHVEGVSSGTATDSGMKAFQPINALKFQGKWANFLAERKYKFVAQGASRAISTRPKLLFIDALTPEPDKDAGSLESLNLMLLFSQMGFEVTFIPEGNFLRVKPYTAYMASLGIRVIHSPYFSNLRKFLKRDDSNFGVVVIARPTVANNSMELVRLRYPNAKIVYVATDLHYLRMTREAESKGLNTSSTEIVKMKRLEFAAISRSDAVIVHSDFELDLLNREFPGKLKVAKPLSSNSAAELVGREKRAGVLFLGNFLHSPNVDAVQHFVVDILPLILAKRPDTVFYIAGGNAGPEVHSLEGENVKILGHISKLTHALNSVQVLVAPLRFGAGFKGKIATALSNGLPVVTTSIGIEGMGLVKDEEVLLGDDETSFAKHVLSLLEDATLWSGLQQRGYLKALRCWGPEAGWKTVSTLLDSLGVEHARAIPERIVLHDLEKTFTSG